MFFCVYNPVKTDECKADRRGSLVNLTPGTAYEIVLILEGTDCIATLQAATWSETFPVAATEKCANGATTLQVKKSTAADGYILYRGTGVTLGCGNNIDYDIWVDASYVILRGFTLKHVKRTPFASKAGITL